MYGSTVSLQQDGRAGSWKGINNVFIASCQYNSPIRLETRTSPSTLQVHVLPVPLAYPNNGGGTMVEMEEVEKEKKKGKIRG
mmetsp:Transcript_22678/g.47055  ORF Transcript_22678/g.47055 Transcript_22678/m.47055 type:complete len:82 (-) Transcript_22678:396-641(-)